MKNIFKPLLFGLGGVAAMAAPVALISSCSSDSGFDSNKIGIYVEDSWKDAFNKAIEVYNKNFEEGGIWAKDKDTKTEIQTKVKGAFDAAGLLDSVGYQAQETADLIYLPFDRIGSSAENGAIEGFDEVGFKEVLGDQANFVMDADKDKTISDTEFQAYANSTKYDKDGKANKDFFAFTQNKEALVAFTKGKYSDSSMTIDQIINDVNNTNTKKEDWATKSMYNAKFYDLWFSIGILAGYMNSQNGKTVGEAIVRLDPKSNKYVSDLTSISTATTGVSSQLKAAVEKIAEWLNTSYTKGADWFLPADGSNTQDQMAEKNFKGAKNAWLLDGPWNKSKWTDKKNGDVTVMPVQDIVQGKKFTQAPGGWAYAFNARNFKDGKAVNESKVRDMKRFFQIIMGNTEVIKLMYSAAGKITAGVGAKDYLLNTAYKEESVNKQLINAVYTSSTLDARPDTGNVKFGIAWQAWDQNGWRESKTKANIYKKEGFTTAAVLEAIQKSFTDAIKKANSDK